MTLWLQALGIARAKVVDRLSDPAGYVIASHPADGRVDTSSSMMTVEQIAAYMSILDGAHVEAVARELASQGRCANAACGCDLGASDTQRAATAKNAAVSIDDDSEDDEEARRGMPIHRGTEAHDPSSSDEEGAAFDRKQRQSNANPRKRAAPTDVADAVRAKLPAVLFCSNDCCVAMREAALRGHQVSVQDPFLVQQVQMLFPGLKMLEQQQLGSAATGAATVQVREVQQQSTRRVAFADPSIATEASAADGSDKNAAKSAPSAPAAAASQQRPAAPMEVASPKERQPQAAAPMAAPSQAPATQARPSSGLRPVGSASRRMVPLRAPSVVPSREASGVLIATVTPFTAWIFQTNFKAHRTLLPTLLRWVPVEALSSMEVGAKPSRPPHRRPNTADDVRCTRLRDGLLAELPRASLLMRADLVHNPRIAQLVNTFVDKTLVFDTEFTCSEEGYLMLLVAVLTAMTATDPDVNKEVAGQEKEIDEILKATHTSEVVFTELVKMVFGV